MRVARTIASFLTAMALALAMVLQATPTPAVAVTGYDSAFLFESDWLIVKPGDTGQAAVTFINVGSVSWQKGGASQVNLATCCPLNSPPTHASWAVTWLSSTAYATHREDLVAPGGRGTYIWNFKAPSNAAPGIYDFPGDLVLAATGEPIHREGYFHRNDVRAAAAPAQPSFISISATAGSSSITATFDQAVCRTAAFAGGDWTSTVNGAGNAISADDLPTCNSDKTNGVTSTKLSGATTFVSGDSVVVTLTAAGAPKISNKDGLSPAAQTRSTTAQPGVAPTISSVSPSTGPSAGGTEVTISGGNFKSGATVTFGGVAAASTSFVDAATLKATTPGVKASTVGVVVSNPDGLSATATNAFTFTAPVISSASATNATTIKLTYDQSVTCNNSASAAAQFKASFGGSDVTATAISCSATGSKTVTLTFSAAIASSSAGGTLTYTQDASTAANRVKSFPKSPGTDQQDAISGQSVSYSALALPAMTGAQASATVNNNIIFVTYNTDLADSTAVGASQFTVCQTANPLICLTVTSVATGASAGAAGGALNVAKLTLGAADAANSFKDKANTGWTVSYTQSSDAGLRVKGANGLDAKSADSVAFTVAP